MIQDYGEDALVELPVDVTKPDEVSDAWAPGAGAENLLFSGEKGRWKMMEDAVRNFYDLFLLDFVTLFYDLLVLFINYCRSIS